MTNYVRILDSVTYAELAKIENVINPLISEQINDVYNFEFETVFDEVSKFARGGNIIEIEDDYFRIATTSKYLNGNYRVFAEHVSFALSKAYFEDYVGEGVDGTAEEILTPMLNQVGWGIGRIASTDVKFYKPSTGASVRKQIIDVANLFGLEIIWNKFSVSLVNLRGSIDPIPFTLGENLIGVSETIDLTGEDPEVSYEVDVLDLSQLDGFEGFVKINLGDVVSVLAPNVDLNIISRIVYRQYNPFSKVNVNVHIGSVVRDFTTYMRDEKEDEAEEADETANYFLSTFKVGQVDCLRLSGIEMDFESVLPENVSTGVDYFVEGEHKGVEIALKSQYSNYYATVTKFYEDGSYNDFNLSNANMQSWNLPEKNLIALTVTVSQVPWNEVDLEIHKAAVYGVTFNKVYIDALREFKIGKHNVLNMNALIDTEGAKVEIEDISSTIEYHLMQELEGVKLSLRSEFKNYAVAITTLNSDGKAVTYDYQAIQSQLETWKLPREDAELLLVSITEVPSGQFNPAVHKGVTYGVAFDKVPFEALSQLKVGDVDCLYLSGVMLSPNPKLNEIQAEVFYSEHEELKGFKMTLKREYRDYYARITVRDNKGKATTHSYDEIMEWNFPSKKVESIVIEVLEKPPGQFDSALHNQAWYGFKFTQSSDDQNSTSGVNYYFESETVKVTSGGAQFDFTVPYDAVISVTLGVGKTEQVEPVTAEWSLIQDESEMFTGVSVDVKGLTSSEVDVSVQAVCQEGIEEVEEEEGEPIG